MKVVYYDLSTSGFVHATAEIIRIGAKVKVPGTRNFNEYDEYLVPNGPIARRAQEINDMSKLSLLKMKFHGQADNQSTGFWNFDEFLRDQQDYPSEEILLVSLTSKALEKELKSQCVKNMNQSTL